MKFKLLLFFSFIPFFLLSQADVYKQLNLGKYNCAFSDTIVFSKTNYNFENYSGQYPLFVQIWYPSLNKSQPKMKWKDMRKPVLGHSLVTIYQELLKACNSSFIEYNIRDDYPDYNPINYGKFGYEEVFEKILEFETNSVSRVLSEVLDYPVIVYHHGSQGCSDENLLMAEYFASHGYVFVSANFNLPYTDNPFGLVEGVSPSGDNLFTLMDFAKSITTSDKIYFIGHSWGAQKGWTTLSQDQDVDGFVSMETTIEFKSDTTEIMEKWAHVYKSLKLDDEKIKCPVLALANTQNSDPFWFFKESSTSTICFASVREEFGHESYTSAFFMRHFFNDQFPQPDSVQLQRQFEIYTEQLDLMMVFLRSDPKLSNDDFGRFEGDFFFSCYE